MSSSFPSSLDLNLAPPTQTRVQGVAPVWMPYFASSRGPVTVNDSILLDNEVAIGVARSLVTPRDVRILGTRDDNHLVSDVVALSVQSAASIACVGHRLITKCHEVQILRALLEENQRQLQLLQEGNAKLSKMVEDMQKQLEALDNPGKRKRDNESSSREKVVIFGGSSDESQAAMRKNPREEIQKAKLKNPILEL